MKAILKLCLLIFMCSCSMTTPKPEKINGISFVAARDAIDDQHVSPVVNLNANYAAVMPFGFIRDLTHPEIIYNTDRQWYGETKEGAMQYIDVLKKNGIRIMLKPQIWVWKGEFTGYIEMDSDADWKLLEMAYSNYILEYAKLAQEKKVELFCIGTELEKFVENRPEYWNNLILEIKKVYKGRLTYAANWDEFKRTPFWKDLDFIGIDAYFPVSNTKTPTVEECNSGWETHKTLIKGYSDKLNRPVLFTEFGYRSVDYTGKEPWKSDRNMNTVNLEAQANATQSIFDTFWNEDWFAGGFIWKWYHHHDVAGGNDNARFTPQNKPAEAIIRDVYQKN